jgi:hypothetical protein
VNEPHHAARRYASADGEEEWNNDYTNINDGDRGSVRRVQENSEKHSHDAIPVLFVPSSRMRIAILTKHSSDRSHLAIQTQVSMSYR